MIKCQHFIKRTPLSGHFSIQECFGSEAALRHKRTHMARLLKMDRIVKNMANCDFHTWPDCSQITNGKYHNWRDSWHYGPLFNNPAIWVFLWWVEASDPDALYNFHCIYLRFSQFSQVTPRRNITFICQIRTVFLFHFILNGKQETQISSFETVAGSKVKMEHHSDLVYEYEYNVSTGCNHLENGIGTRSW